MGNLHSKLVFVIVILALVSSCTSEDADTFPPLNFNVNRTLLGEVISFETQKLHISIPKESIPLKKEDMIVMIAAIDQDTTARVRTTPLYAATSAEGVNLVISKVNQPGFTPGALDDNYLAHLSMRYGNTQITRNQYSVNGIKAVQYLIVDQSQVLIKLFCFTENTCTQIDYLTLATNYSKHSTAIESSIGSITAKK